MRKTLLFVLLLAASVLSTSARAQGPNTGVNVQIQPVVGQGRYCLDARGDRDQDGAPVFIYACRGSENQHWTIASATDDKHAILGIGGFCLDAGGGSPQPGANTTQLWRCHFGATQRFVFTPDGHIRESGTNKCLMAVAPRDAAPVVLDTCNANPNEAFVVRH
jgi:glucosylceramidase